MARNSSPSVSPPSKALAVLDTGSEIALPVDLDAAAHKYARKSRARRTLLEYASSWKQFEAWCDAHGRRALPASIKTVAGYLTWLAEGGTGRHLAESTLSIRRSAIQYYHTLQGHPLDLKHPDLAVVWQGIRRDIASKRQVRQAKPLEFRELREILDARRPDVMRDVQDSALLGLGGILGLRRSELVGLDYQQLGTTEDELRVGYLTIDEDGLEVVLMTSKSSQAQAKTVPVKREYAPTMLQVVEEWVAAAKIKPGEPLFVSLGKNNAHGSSEAPQSPYRGVSWDKGAGKWRAQIALPNRKTKRLGLFKDPYQAHLAWANAKGVAPQDKGVQRLGRKRLDNESVPRAVRRRVRAYLEEQAKKRGGPEKLTKATIDAKVKEYSGHSLRAGCVTSLAKAGVPVWKIMPITRQSQGIVHGYIRVVEKREESGLRGVAF